MRNVGSFHRGGLLPWKIELTQTVYTTKFLYSFIIAVQEGLPHNFGQKHGTSPMWQLWLHLDKYSSTRIQNLDAARVMHSTDKRSEDGIPAYARFGRGPVTSDRDLLGCSPNTHSLTLLIENSFTVAEARWESSALLSISRSTDSLRNCRIGSGDRVSLATRLDFPSDYSRSSRWVWFSWTKKKKKSRANGCTYYLVVTAEPISTVKVDKGHYDSLVHSLTRFNPQLGGIPLWRN